eukprot:757436-Hanusia_phi.AAC.16
MKRARDSKTKERTMLTKNLDAPPAGASFYEKKTSPPLACLSQNIVHLPIHVQQLVLSIVCLPCTRTSLWMSVAMERSLCRPVRGSAAAQHADVQHRLRSSPDCRRAPRRAG